MSSVTRKTAVSMGAALALAAVAIVTLRTGSWPLAWPDALSLTGMDATILWELRMPRALAAILAGACLGVSGAVFQTMLRNPLASPDLIGFTAGASAGAVATIAVTGGTAYVTAGAVGGGFVTSVLVFALAWRNGLDPLRLVLIGLVFGITLMALTNFLLGVSGPVQAGDVIRWLAGSFNARGWSAALTLAVVLALIAPVLWYLAFTLDRLDTGDDLARLLGLRVDAARLFLGLSAVVLASAAVSICGPLPFVAFMAGPIARMLARSPTSCLLLAGLAGATITLLADLAARIGFQGFHLPAGIYTALIGGPYLLGLVLLQTKRNRL